MKNNFIIIGVCLFCILAVFSCKKAENMPPPVTQTVATKKKITLEIEPVGRVMIGKPIQVHLKSDIPLNNNVKVSYTIQSTDIAGAGAATISADGILKAVKEGAVTLIVTVTENDNYVSSIASKTIQIISKSSTGAGKAPIGEDLNEANGELPEADELALAPVNDIDIPSDDARLPVVIQATGQFTFQGQFISGKFGGHYGIGGAPKINLKYAPVQETKYVIVVYQKAKILSVYIGESKVKNVKLARNQPLIYMDNCVSLEHEKPAVGLFNIVVFTVAKNANRQDVVSLLKKGGKFDLSTILKYGNRAIANRAIADAEIIKYIQQQ